MGVARFTFVLPKKGLPTKPGGARTATFRLFEDNFMSLSPTAKLEHWLDNVDCDVDVAARGAGKRARLVCGFYKGHCG
jgi:hypothetical protein